MALQLPAGFPDFIAAGVDRFAFLRSYLGSLSLRASAVELAGGRHLFVSPSRSGYPQGRPRTVLVAHYDRAEGSPGANDNSAAVFMLARTARRLEAEGKDGWLIVFTDREEVAGEDGPRAQGAYALAQAFKSIGLDEADFFIFDACGRGDTVIVSTTVDGLLAGDAERPERAIRESRDLRGRALDAGRAAHAKKVLLAPTPFSDDAGFLAAGLTAQTVTVLPQEEASVLARSIRGRPEYAQALINRGARDRLDPALLAGFYPRTWTLMHGRGDTAESLTPASFQAVERFAFALAGNA
jgi:hypothetical protein